jgi:hypothetical protein
LLVAFRSPEKEFLSGWKSNLEIASVRWQPSNNAPTWPPLEHPETAPGCHVERGLDQLRMQEQTPVEPDDATDGEHP